MLKAHKKTLIMASIVTLLPILAGLLFWSRLPEVMATHFGTDNAANGFSSKAFAVFGIPLFCLALLWVGAIVTSHDPKKQNISPRLFTLVLWIAPVVSLVGAAAIYPYNLGYEINNTFIGELLMGLLLVVVGNYLPKARRNYTVGIRIPWTLADEENWNRTHRLAGFLWVACGILILILTLTGIVPARFIIGLVFAAALVPCIYSFWLHAARGL